MVVEKRKPIPIKEAIERIVKQDIYTQQNNISLEDSLGYVLAEDIVATYDIPRFNKSPYDGFAI
ncbi:MAG: molybdopterin molybdenumtransferase MoeA, partial [Staphylococcus sp.]|nr:molybdopterin molybdenumtransferase MoeA [Staphylococcus sp.]